MEVVRRHGRVVVMGMLGCALAALLTGRPAQGAGPAKAKEPERIGAEVCLQCHSQYQKTWYTLRHNRWRKSDSAPETMRGCEGCHGPGGAHLEDEKFGKIKNPRKLTGLAAAESCFQCHATDVKPAAWLQTPHAKGGLGCGTCHEVHYDTKQPANLKQAATKLCLSCHPEQEANFRLNSHHPVLEGRVNCVDCHDPHNEGAPGGQQLKSGDDRCVRCHMEKRGPFVFEHQVGTGSGDDTCSQCHRPHGSSNPKLGQLYGNGVCLQCHTDITASPTHKARPGSCFQSGCHSKFHGSNNNRWFIN